MSKQLRQDYPHLGGIHSRQELKRRGCGRENGGCGRKRFCIWKQLSYLVEWKGNLFFPLNSNLIWGLADWYTKDTRVLPTWFFSSGSEVHKKGSGESEPFRITANFLSKGLNIDSLIAFFDNLLHCSWHIHNQNLFPGVLQYNASHGFKWKLERSILKLWITITESKKISYTYNIQKNVQLSLGIHEGLVPGSHCRY